MILEGIITTTNPDGSANITPMGPIVDEKLTRLILRPYLTSTTFQNLSRTRQGVFHVTDDVELLARAAVDRLEAPPRLVKSKTVNGWILADACRWGAFEVRQIDDSSERARIEAVVIESGEIRNFFGLNRAKHAVVEAAILATRASFLPSDDMLQKLRWLAPLVDKTGGPAERRAFAFLNDYIQAACASRQATSHEQDTERAPSHRPRKG